MSIRRFPSELQLDAMDCGPACLRMVARYYGRKIPLQILRDRCHISKEGVSLLGINLGAQATGFNTVALKVPWSRLRDELPLPCIAHWNQNHFVVIYDIAEGKGGATVKVSDPAVGRLDYSEEEFLKGWCPAGGEGICLCLEPGENFYTVSEEQEGTGRYGFTRVFAYLLPHGKKIAGILTAMLLASLISLVMPFLTQAIVDKGIGNRDVPYIVMVLIAQMMLTLGLLVNNLIRSRLMLKTTTRVSISLISDFLGKLMRLPVSFLDRRHVGDILQRISDHNRIQRFLTGTLLSMAVAIVSFIVYGIVMAKYNALIFVIFLLGTALYVIWVLMFMRRRRKLDYLRFQQSAANQNNLVQLVGGMQDIKLNNCEDKKRLQWEGIQEKLYDISIRSLNLGQIQEIGSTFIDQSKGIIISFIAAKAVIDGDMTLGMMMALQYVMGQLSAPVSQFISFVQAAQDASISLERLGEIQGMEDEEPTDAERIEMIPEGAGIELRDMCFSYGGATPRNVLDGISLRIPSGKVTAITGASGSGKTTLLKLLLGFYRPVSGEVLVAGSPLESYRARSWRAACGSVMQEGFIFSDTIAANIALSGDQADLERVREAAGVANIDGWIESLPLGYDTMLGQDGHGLSTGQKQRILIARTVFKEARYLFFDEATNSLDADNESVIMERLSRVFAGRTVVIVAHRLSTVRNADNIVVLDGGRIAEQGTHEELLALRGRYWNLVRNQI